MSNNELKRYAQAVSIPLSVSDAVKWPIRAGRAIKPVKTDFANSYAEQLDKALNKFGDSFWNKAFENPSQIWRVSHHLVNGWKDGNYDKAYIGSRIIQLLSGIKQLSNGISYEILGPHLTEPTANIFIENGLSSAHILKLSGLLWAYAETMYYVAREICCDYQGPYNITPDTSILVRQYSNLCPTDLWPQLSALNNIDSIIIKSKHRNLDIVFDVYNNLYINQGNIMDSFVDGEVLINGCRASLEDIQSLIHNVTNEMILLHTTIESMSEEEIIWQYIRIFWYRKKGIAHLLGEDWEPPYELRSKLGKTRGSSKKKSTSRPSKEDVEKQYDYS